MQVLERNQLHGQQLHVVPGGHDLLQLALDLVQGLPGVSHDDAVELSLLPQHVLFGVCVEEVVGGLPEAVNKDPQFEQLEQLFKHSVLLAALVVQNIVERKDLGEFNLILLDLFVCQSLIRIFGITVCSVCFIFNTYFFDQSNLLNVAFFFPTGLEFLFKDLFLVVLLDLAFKCLHLLMQPLDQTLALNFEVNAGVAFDQRVVVEERHRLVYLRQFLVLLHEGLIEEDEFVEFLQHFEELELAILVGVVVVGLVDQCDEHVMRVDVGLFLHLLEVGFLLLILFDVLVLELASGALVVCD
mmetsp:Transcript_21486/g.47892  ORF Transcript_21486/g.47892 Transcript_21486/m.47892 type:complete len:299 (-) Transcript_21486:436-1332(-)